MCVILVRVCGVRVCGGFVFCRMFFEFVVCVRMCVGLCFWSGFFVFVVFVWDGVCVVFVFMGCLCVCGV